MEKHSIQRIDTADSIDDIPLSNKEVERNQPLPSQPDNVKRKPLPPTYTFVERENAAEGGARTAAQEQWQQQQQRQFNGPLPGPPRTAPTFVARLRQRWARFPRNTRIIILSVLVLFFLIILVVPIAVTQTRKSGVSNLPLPSNHGGPYTGELTYYDPALGACGFTNSGSDSIVAVSHIIFDAVSVGSNPNANPLCGKKIRARLNGKSMDVTVVDRCTGCAKTDLDVTRSVFQDLAGDLGIGRTNVEWSWLEGVPGAAS